MEHVTELLYRLKRIFISIIIIGAILSLIPIDFKYYIPLVSYFPNLIINYVIPKRIVWHGTVINVHIAQYNPFAGFNLLIKSALLLGLLGASPIIVHEIYAFIAPALYPHEKKFIRNITIVGLFLFLLGIIVSIKIVLPTAYKIMIITSSAITGPNTLIAFSDIEQLFSSIILISVATGLALEAPLIVYLLVSFGVIEYKWFKGENKKFILFLSMLIGAVISPDPSGMGMVVIGMLMYISIMFSAKLGDRYKKRKEENNVKPVKIIKPEPELVNNTQS